MDKTICKNCGNWTDSANGEPWNHSCPDPVSQKQPLPQPTSTQGTNEMDNVVATNAVMACIRAAYNAAERGSAGDADEAVRYAEAARTLSETLVTMKHVNET